MPKPPRPPSTRPPKPPRRRPPNPDDDPGHGGRRPKFNALIALKICELVSKGNYRYQAAQAVGIHKRTLRRWLKLGVMYPGGDYAAFCHLLAEAEGAAEANTIVEIEAQGKYGVAPENLRWLAERRWPQRWGKNRVDLVETKRQLVQAEARVDQVETENETLREELRKRDAVRESDADQG